MRRLKQETLGQHESLEQHLQLLRQEMSLQDYRNLLEKLYGFYASWEQRAAPFLDRVLPGFFSDRRKTPLLVRDLLYLGSEPAALRECPNLPATDSLLPLLGSLYVLEGATLGGQILTRHFVRQFNLSSHQGCSFFAGYGVDTGCRWRDFCKLLISHSSPEHDTVIVQSAIQTFCCFGS
ncbi:MAG: biliverdin-producing heme oxygenase, partial [Bryobacteraceae bacterium]